MRKRRYNRVKRKNRGKCKKERRYSKVKGESRNAARSGDVDKAIEMANQFFGIKKPSDRPLGALIDTLEGRDDAKV